MRLARETRSIGVAPCRFQASQNSGADHAALAYMRNTRPMFTAITTDGVTDGHTTEKLDVILWCTGFRPALRHLQPLHLHTEGSGIVLDGNHVRGEPTLVFLGYGDWTGPASATLIGVGRTARAAVDTLVRRGKVDQS